MTAIADDELRRHLSVNRDPLSDLRGDEHYWRLGPVDVRKNDAMFRVGYAHPALPSTRFVLQAFSLDGRVGTAVVLLSGGKPPHYFVGWVPVGREVDATRWVETLNATLRSTTSGAAAASTSDLAAAEGIIFESGNENAPDSPYGAVKLTLSRAGALGYERKRAGAMESQRGVVSSERVHAVIDALRRTTFPAPPQTRFVPGGSISRITLKPSGETVQVDYFEALRMEGYRDVVQQLTKLATAIREKDAATLTAWEFRPRDVA